MRIFIKVIYLVNYKSIYKMKPLMMPLISGQANEKLTRIIFFTLNSVKMKNSLLAFMILFASLTAVQAQVGVNTLTPKSTLDINGSFGSTITEVNNPSGFVVNETHQVLVFRGTAEGSGILPDPSTCPGREYTLVNFIPAYMVFPPNQITWDEDNEANFIPALTIFTIKSNGTKWIRIAHSQEKSIGGGTTIKKKGQGTFADPIGFEMKFFYMPSIAINTSATGTGFTVNLYNVYKDQFMSPLVKNPAGSASIPFFAAASALNYYITDYDTSLFANVSVSDAGILTYDVIGSASDCSFMNIVFVVK